MIFYNATFANKTSTPRCGMLNPNHLWLNVRPYDTQPTDAGIADALKDAGDAELYVLDDAHGLDLAGQAQLMARVRAFTKKQLAIYGPPGSFPVLRLLDRNLIPDGDSFWDYARDLANKPIWGKKVNKPWLAAVDCLCPDLYCMGDSNRWAEDRIDTLMAWRLSAENNLARSRYIAGNKPIIPFLFLNDAAINPQDIVTFLASRGISEVVIWGDSQMNSLL